MKKIVILIHGYLTDYNDFNHLPNKLTKLYDYVVLISLPGHGKYHDMKKFKVNDTIQLIEDEVEFYSKIGYVDLIGYSLGGALVRYLCVKYKTIKKAVLISPATYYFSPLFGIERMKYLFSAKTKDERKKNHQELRNNDKMAYYVVRRHTFKRFKLDNGITFCKLIKKINKIKGFNPTSTLIIWGKLDELVPKSSVNFCYQNCINNKKALVMIDGVGHVIPRSNKEKIIIDKIMEFLNE